MISLSPDLWYALVHDIDKGPWCTTLNDMLYGGCWDGVHYFDLYAIQRV